MYWLGKLLFSISWAFRGISKLILDFANNLIDVFSPFFLFLLCDINFCMLYFNFYLILGIFKVSSWVFPWPNFLSIMSYFFPGFVKFLQFLLLLRFRFVHLLSEFQDVNSIFFHLLRFTLFPHMWMILEKAPFLLRKNVFFNVYMKCSVSIFCIIFFNVVI